MDGIVVLGHFQRKGPPLFFTLTVTFAKTENSIKMIQSIKLLISTNTICYFSISYNFTAHVTQIMSFIYLRKGHRNCIFIYEQGSRCVEMSFRKVIIWGQLSWRSKQCCLVFPQPQGKSLASCCTTSAESEHLLNCHMLHLFWISYFWSVLSPFCHPYSLLLTFLQQCRVSLTMQSLLEHAQSLCAFNFASGHTRNCSSSQSLYEASFFR